MIKFKEFGLFGFLGGCSTASSHIFNANLVGDLVFIYIYIYLASSMIRYPYTFRYLSSIYGMFKFLTEIDP